MGALEVVDVNHEYFLSHTKKIKETVREIAEHFYYMGFLLREVKEYEYYRAGGYSDFVQYAEHELGFKKSAAYNLIKLVERYGAKDGGGYKIWIDEKYKDYNQGQLTEMLSLSPAKAEKVTPDMTVKQIREIKKVESGNEIFQTSGIEITAPALLNVLSDKRIDDLYLKIESLNDDIRYLKTIQSGLYDLVGQIDANFSKLTKGQIRNAISDFLSTGEITFSEE